LKEYILLIECIKLTNRPSEIKKGHLEIKY
jgi:hypothetical protein